MAPMPSRQARPPLALRLVEPLVERAGLRVMPTQEDAVPFSAALSRTGRARRLLERRGWTVRRPYPADFDAALIATIERVRPYTITSDERLAAMVAGTEHVVRSGLPGAIVECGVWRGGSMMAAAETLLRLGVRDRELYLFDTFDGMTQPGPADVVRSGDVRTAAETLEEINAWCRIDQAEVRRNLLATGYPAERVHLVEGPVEETVPALAPEQIALLRLDTDWYASTAHEMRHLYPRLCAGGILLVDDYGEWSGARQAVDEYFGDAPPFLHRVDYTARLVLKP
jgi:hypothetical protein